MIDKKTTKKYAEMKFEDYFEEWKERINKVHKKDYDDESWFAKLFDTPYNPLLEKEFIKSIAKAFFIMGRLKEVSFVRKQQENW